MADQSNQFPSTVTLNGADYFLLQLDRMMVRTSHRNNVCTFVVSLKEPLAPETLEQSLLSHQLYVWVTRLRFTHPFPLTLARWVFDKTLPLPQIKQCQLLKGENQLESYLATDINIRKDSPFKIDLLHTADEGSILVFTWHHVLMDAHGGESFIRSLGLEEAITLSELIKDESVDLPLKDRANIAQDMKVFLSDTSQLPLLSLYKKPSWLKKSQATLRYRVTSFSTQQTQDIMGVAREQGAGFLLSAFYLAATTCAVSHVHQQREGEEGDVLVPVPLDRRKRGEDSPLIRNQVTFLFYRIPQQLASDIKRCTAELIEQMKVLMRTDSPRHYLIMMDFLRRIPGFFYRMMLKQPTKGLMASFFYSDTGESLQGFDQFLNISVKSAIHYPPVMHPPGITFVFSRFKGALKITLGYMEEVVSEDEVEQIIATLRSTLLNSTDVNG
jgi:hypothetical protein